MGREKGPRVGGAGARHAVGPGGWGGSRKVGTVLTPAERACSYSESTSLEDSAPKQLKTTPTALSRSSLYPSKSPFAGTQPRTRTPASCPLVQGPFSFLVQERPESREGPLHQEARSCPGSPTHQPVPSPAPPHSWSWDPSPPHSGRWALYTPRGTSSVQGMTGSPGTTPVAGGTKPFPVQFQDGCTPPVRSGAWEMAWTLSTP